ncbi:MAG TPA: 30S ribosomal protein S4 [Patescibacteria group bacterium]
MGRYIGPKDKLSRREGMDLFGKGAKLRKLAVKPGGTPRRNSKVSEYGVQLRAKQKAKRLYGLMERQFGNYVRKAGRTKGRVGDALVSLLERRLDNVVYRAGWAKTRPAARQLVTHKHVLVNGLILNVPSHILKINDIVELKPSIRDNPAIEEAAQTEREPVNWINKENFKAKVSKEPDISDLTDPISIADIIEFYSR